MSNERFYFNYLYLTKYVAFCDVEGLQIVNANLMQSVIQIVKQGVIQNCKCKM